MVAMFYFLMSLAPLVAAMLAFAAVAPAPIRRLVLNSAVGGINPDAVNWMCRMQTGLGCVVVTQKMGMAHAGLLAAGQRQDPAMSTRVQEKAIARQARSDPTSRIIGA